MVFFDSDGQNTLNLGQLDMLEQIFDKVLAIKYIDLIFLKPFNKRYHSGGLENKLYQLQTGQT